MRRNLDKIIILCLLLCKLSVAKNKYIIFDIGNDPYRKNGAIITSNEIESYDKVKKIGLITTDNEKKVKDIFFSEDEYYKKIEDFLNNRTFNLEKFKEINNKSIDEYNEFMLMFKGFKTPYLGPEKYNDNETEVYNLTMYLIKSSNRLVILGKEDYLKYEITNSKEEKIDILKCSIKDYVMLDTTKTRCTN